MIWNCAHKFLFLNLSVYHGSIDDNSSQVIFIYLSKEFLVMISVSICLFVVFSSIFPTFLFSLLPKSAHVI